MSAHSLIDKKKTEVTVRAAEASSPGRRSQRNLSFVVGGIFWWLTVGGEMIS